MKIEFDAEEVKRQLQRLHDALPDDDVDIWIKVEVLGKPSPVLCYTAYVRQRGDFQSACANEDTLTDAVDRTIAQVGPRDGSAQLRAKRIAIEKAEAELEKLRAEIDPLAAAIDKAKSDQERQNP